MRQPTRRAFTLVELLVVITVIGVLMGLLLPAIQAARESGRSATCSNNVKQLATACLAHEAAQNHLPTGGWAWGWAGEPDRGFGTRQPGGWLYNILPFIEQTDLHDMENATERVAMPVQIFLCPTRHSVKSYPYNSNGSFNEFHNISSKPLAVGRCDYAACAGDLTADPESKHHSPRTDWDGAGADKMSEQEWQEKDECRDARYSTGVIFRRSKILLGHVSDGESNTYLIGERYLAPEKYEGQNGFYEKVGLTDDHNDQAWDMGYDYENTRWTRTTDTYKPMRDRSGFEHDRAFGSAHSAGFYMALCDGSVHRINFNIDQELHRRLGNRKDGDEIDHSEFID